ncbi:D-alanyl-D-alanine carboxypeptidase family protein [Cellulomonas fengjieae]|uniref:D-alanyl-D-alanine carboxypeptidase family protein n=1 Tax=Cellulomonas fengjieae TaxID=2819978 RepID=A0ABS3SF76_9CELL|nr:D-alanyl-D-alanine carboxypeptidase family protein [Cellulomonas fengjieae]MBO3083974.1 D-alanyl-D-alanine carboxypeptidase family protein [Cellulomonas fengjieae]QVI64758.1 D-alanyl-D-alanine carboxypeptidase family protein [Cellulomonas fengjieae]
MTRGAQSVVGRERGARAHLAVRAVVTSACVIVATLGLAPWASAAPGEGELRPGEVLASGEALVSADGSQTLVVQPDGVLALFGAEPEPRWVAGPTVPGSRLVVGENGDVALTAADGTVVWRPEATGGPGSRLVLQDDGDVVVLDPQGTQVWESGTAVRPSILPAGGVLGPGDALASPDGRHALLLRDDGQLALLGPDAATRWSPGTDQPGAGLTLREDGDLVVTDAAGEVLWRSRTAGHPGASLVLQDDGDLALYDAAGAAVWSTGTVVGPPSLAAGVPLAVGQVLGSPDGHVRLVLGTDGLTLAYDDTVVWTAGAAGAAALTVQDDGNVVLTGADGAVLWAAMTQGHPGATVQLEESGLLVRASTGQELWRVDVPTDLVTREPVATDCTEVTGPVPQDDTVVTESGVRVHSCLAEAVDALMSAAREDGIELHAGGWRSASQQIALRAKNCGPAASDPTVVACRPPTAPPGTSRHERGLALDFTIGGSVLRAGSPAFLWLAEHAADYGLENLPGEPWHWSVDGW